MSIKFGVVVNYFSKKTHPISVKYSAKFALSLLKNCPEVSEIVLSDGSAEQDDELSCFCDSLEIKYVHSGKMMSFAEGYNYGVEHLTEDWIATMASDIYVTPTTFTAIMQFITENEKLNVGCLIPYLSKSDLPTQQFSTSFFSRDCFAPGMTFNLNIFKKNVFEELGGMTREYSGNFNDFEMWLKLKEIGLGVYLVGNSYAMHYGQLTLTYGSNTNAIKDREQFYKKHPYLLEEGSFFNMRIDKFFQSRILKYLYGFKSLLPSTRRNMYIVSLLKILPVLQKIK
jgi:GT2 family glycosyltransferase